MTAINDLGNRRIKMSLDSIFPPTSGLRDTSADSTSRVGAIFACMRNGMSVTREARRLYAMDDEALRQEGLTREDIPAHLASLL